MRISDWSSDVCSSDLTTIDHRIVDFLCPANGLIVEVDGSTHDRERDDALDRRMAAQYGYRTIRVTNEEMFGNMDGVQQHIQHVAYQTPDRWISEGRQERK